MSLGFPYFPRSSYPLCLIARGKMMANDDHFFFRWGQTYILEALMYYVPDEQQDAELLAERISIRLQHSNSAVVLTTVKVIMYLMNYMGSQEIIESMCRKLSPPLGSPLFPSFPPRLTTDAYFLG